VDENTRKVIDHGRRIRACLKQSELAPVSVPAQITVLLALMATLFDPVPLDRMTEAERAVQEAALDIPADIRARFGTAADLKDEDRKAIIAMALRALAPFYPKLDANSEANAKLEANAKAESDQSKSKAGPGAQS
jgi:F-type H+-transporting ATPase subunit alpha